MAEIVFPQATGSNLLRKRIELPGGLTEQFNIVVIAYQQWQQPHGDTWIPTLGELEQAFPGLADYELPTIYEMNFLSRTFLNEGMRAGIPNQKARERTITLYLDKAGFRRSLGIESEGEITVLLIDRAGQVYWRTTGVFEEVKARELAQTLAKHIPPAFETIWARG